MQVDWVELVTKAREGDRMAFAALVDRFRHPVCVSVLPILRDWHLAQDVSQEAFAAAYRALAGLRESHRFRGWLFRIARNHAVSRLRHRTQFRPRSLVGVEEDDIVGHLRDAGCVLTDGRRGFGVSQAMLSRVRRVVAALPNQYGALLVMRHMEGLSVAEMAEATGRTPKAVKAVLYRARALARRVLSRRGLDIEQVLNEM